MIKPGWRKILHQLTKKGLFFKKSLSFTFSPGRGWNVFRMSIKIPTAEIFGILSLISQRDSWSPFQLAG